MIGIISRLFGAAAPRYVNKRPVRNTLAFDTLEAREVPSVNASDFRVPTTVTNNQFEVANASSSNGMSVVVWTHRYSNSDTDVYAQMYKANGSKQGSEIRVATSSKVEGLATVAMDNYGDWKVAWVQGTTSTNRDIKVARYSSSGSKLGSTITIAGTSKSEYDPSIAVDRFGNFVVSYTIDYSSTDQDVRAKRYDDNGVFQQEIIVANSGSADETRSSVSRSAGTNGVFAIAYTTAADVTLKRYSASGSLINTHLVATGSNTQNSPSVSMDHSGNSVVAWQEYISGDWDLKSRKVSSTGLMGSVTNIVATSANETNVSIAMNRTNGTYVVVYQAGSTVYVREFNSNGTQKAAKSLGTRSSVALPMVSIDANSDFFVTYTDIGRSGDAGLGAYGRFGHL